MKNPGLYILTNTVNSMQYVGKDSNLPRRSKEHLSGKNPQCRRIHRAIQKYGQDAFSVEIIRYPGISYEALNAVERWKIRQLQTLSPSGCNLTEGGDGGNTSEETRQKISEIAAKRVADGTHNFLDGEIARRTNRKRVADGTHNLLGENNPNQKRLDEGTHNFLDGEIQRRVQKKRVADGTHHLLDGEIQRCSAQKRVADGTHNFLGENNPVHKQLEDGTHNFLDSEFQRRAQIKRDAVNKKRLEDGTHHFLDGEIARRTNKKQLEDGTHNFLDSEFQRRAQIKRDAVNKKRLEDGTHNFLGENNPIKRLSKDGKHPLTLKRLKGEWCYIIALSRFWYEIHDYTLKRRAEFLSKDIPDTSNAEQEYLF